jgi:hypothetical protein
LVCKYPECQDLLKGCVCSLSQHLCCARALLETGDDSVAFYGVFLVATDQQEWVLEVAKRVQKPATVTSQERTAPAPIDNVGLNLEFACGGDG